MKTTTKNRNKKWEALMGDNAGSLIGKKIKWQAPADSINKDYGGVSKITDVLSDGTIISLTIQGDDLQYAHLDKIDGYWYSDSDRFVTFQVEEL